MRAARELFHRNGGAGGQRFGFEVFAIDVVEAIEIRHVVDIRGYRHDIGSMSADFNTVSRFDMICLNSDSNPPLTSCPPLGSPPVAPERYNVSPTRIAGDSGEGVGL